MTGPECPIGRAETARWCEGVADALARAAVQAGGLAAGIAADWLDEHGQEWARRATLLHRELGRDAVAAADLGTALARLGEDLPSPLLAGRAGAVGQDRRVRLGGTEASRVQDDVGMQVVQLPAVGEQPVG